MSRRTTRIAAVSAAILVAGVLSATPALADGPEGPDLTSKSFSAEDEVCSVIAQPTPAGQDVAFTPAPTVQCFDTFGEAIESATGVPVTDPAVEAGEPAALRAFAQDQAAQAQSRSAGPDARAAAPGTTMMLGVAYKGANHTGGNKVFWSNGGYGCMTGNTYGFPKLSPYLMNNNISSLNAYAECWATLYDLENYVKGASTNCVPFCATLGSMNDRASSIVFRPAGSGID
ncbi:hypothetical protein [Oerskovia sp. USHLN155]|uniref:hypothetical protein n=1 Tax=Oerskovia sp. USHLN155 TaxID=3081288 RepID=UPI0030170C4F